MREVGEGGINTKKAIINYHHRAAATGVGWGGVSLTKDQFVTALGYWAARLGGQAQGQPPMWCEPA